VFCLTAALAINFNCDDAADHDDAVSWDVVSSRGDAVNHDDAVNWDVVSSHGDERLVQLQAGHLTKKNKKCPMYVEPEPEVLEPWIPDVMLSHPTTQVGIITLPSLMSCLVTPRHRWAPSQYPALMSSRFDICRLLFVIRLAGWVKHCKHCNLSLSLSHPLHCTNFSWPKSLPYSVMLRAL
jgi:hypothetical protein